MQLKKACIGQNDFFQFKKYLSKDYAKTCAECVKDKNLERKYLLSVSMMRLAAIPPRIAGIINRHAGVFLGSV